MNGPEDDTKFPVKVDTFVNFKDESLMQRTEIAGEVNQTVMRIREEQTVEALKMLGWFAPGEIPAFSDAACIAAQDVYSLTPVLFGERARRMRAALITAMQVHAEEVAQAVAARASELEAKFAPKPETKTLLVSPDGSWIAEEDGDGELEAFRMMHDDHTELRIPLGASDDLCGEIAVAVSNGAPKETVDDMILHWMGG